MLASHYGATSGNVQLPPKSSGNSVELTAGLIVADVVGAGILAMAVGVAKLGWLLGAICILILLAMNVHVSLLMWRVQMYFPSTCRYSEFVSNAFSKAPDNQRQTVVWIAGVAQYSFIFSVLTIYVLNCGRALGYLFYDVRICLPTWMLWACAIIFPFCASARQLGGWPSLVYINVATILGTCLIPLGYMAIVGAEDMRPPGSVFVALSATSFGNVISAVSTFTFAFTSQFMIVEIMSEMKDVSQFPKAYAWLSAPFQAVAFLLVGLGGYYYMGDKVQGMIGDNLPFGVAFRVCGFCLFSHMFITYMVKSIVLCKAAHAAIQKDAEDDESGQAWGVWSILMGATLIVSWSFASTVPFFDKLVDLCGALLAPIACFIIPIVAYLRWVSDFGGKQNVVGNLEMLVIMLELFLAVVALIGGTYFAVVSIMENWRVYGPPFACHCENMWNTCACSGTHSGMLDQCAAVKPAGSLPEFMLVDENFMWLQLGT